MTIRIFGLLVDVRRPIAEPRRWDRTDQAHPVTLAAIFRRSLRTVGRAIAEMTDAVR